MACTSPSPSPSTKIGSVTANGFERVAALGPLIRCLG